MIHEDKLKISLLFFSLGECVKCGETVSNLDDPCDILGQIYHSSCAVCVLCGRSLKNRQFYLQDQLYCEEDFLVIAFCLFKI